MNMYYGEFIPLYSGYKAPERKWYQKIFDFFYNVREIVFMVFIIGIWLGLMILFIKLGYGKMVALCCPVGLLMGLLMGLLVRR